MTLSAHKAFCAHERTTGRDEWLTPPHIVHALGAFDLDPCAPVDRPWDTARHHYTVRDDGLTKPWEGRVWLNPPYGSQTRKWISRLAEHANGIALIFARTETRIFFPWVWSRASALLFLRGRISFHDVSGGRAQFTAGAPSVLVAYGRNNAEALRHAGLDGKFVCLGG